MMRRRRGQAFSGSFLAILTVLTGCQSDPGRVPSSKVLSAHLGRWTYEDALSELGAPSASFELRDHSRIAEWAEGWEATPIMSFRLESSDGGRHSVGGDDGGGDSGRVYRQLQFDQAGKLVEIRDVRH